MYKCRELVVTLTQEHWIILRQRPRNNVLGTKKKVITPPISPPKVGLRFFFEEWRQHIKSGALYVFFLRPHISSIYIIHMQVCVYVVVCLWKRFCAFLPYYSWYSATVVFLCFLKSQLQLFFLNFILLLQYAKAQVSMVQSGCQPPTEKKKTIEGKSEKRMPKTRNWSQKEKRNEWIWNGQKKGEAFRLEHAGLFGGKFDWNQQQCCLYYTTIDVCRRPIISQYTKYIQLFFC